MFNSKWLEGKLNINITEHLAVTLQSGLALFDNIKHHHYTKGFTTNTDKSTGCHPNHKHMQSIKLPFALVWQWGVWLVKSTHLTQK